MTVRRVARRLALLALGLSIGALVAEAMLRGAAAASDRIDQLLEDPLAAKIEPHGTLGYRQRPLAVSHYGNGTSATANRLGFRGPEVSVQKPAGTVRVVLLGGSTSHGVGVNDNETIDAYLRTILAGELPTRRIEVVNLAFDGYDSYQDFERLRTDGLPLDPDVVIVNSGINDVRNAWIDDVYDRDPRTVLWGGILIRLREEQKRGGPTLWTRIRHYSYIARTPSMVRGLGRAERQLPPPSWTPTLAAADNFERNLARIAQMAAERPIPVVFSTPPSALGTPRFAPTDTSDRSYWLPTAAMTQAYRDELDQRMRHLIQQLQARGQQVSYVPHHLQPSAFLDDAHLTPQGNREMAEDFARSVLSLLSARD